MNNGFYTFVSLKSFGDLTILAKHIKMLFVEDGIKVRMLAGSYHSELIEALNLNFKIDLINFKNNEIPSFYDIRNKGLIRATSSLFETRKLLKYNSYDEEVLTFDKIGLREKYLAMGANSASLGKGENIYNNYKEKIKKLFGRIKVDSLDIGPGRDIIICPHASKKFRNIPSNLIDDISIKCLENGFNPLVYTFDDEVLIDCKIPTVIRAKKSFRDLKLSLENSHAVISADSLGAHMAAFISRPVFVVSPYVETKFWLPSSAYEKNHWGLFAKKDEMLISLNNFFADLKNKSN